MNVISRLLALSLIGLLLPLANAADLSVLPVGLSLTSANNKGMITIKNQGNENVVIQTETMSWTQLDGINQYSQNRELLVNPPLFTIAPGNSQVLRVGLRQQTQDSEKETAYRLILREVPNASSPNANIGEGQQLRVLLRLDLPVYISPAKPITLQEWQAERNANGTVTIKLRNKGNVHTLVRELKVHNYNSASGSTPLATLKVNDVVFPGQNGSWVLYPEFELQGRNYLLEINSDQGQQNVSLDLGP